MSSQRMNARSYTPSNPNATAWRVHARCAVMRKAGVAFLLVAAACNSNENVFYGSIGPSRITPFIAFENVNSVISGRAALTNPDGGPPVSAEVVIISDKPRLCERLLTNRDYFRNPPEAYIALILFLPPDNRLGTF